MTAEENKGEKFLDNLLDIQRALTRTMKTMVQTSETHTRMLEAILSQLVKDQDETS